MDRKLIDMKLYYVYILTNYARTVLYTGITNNLERRLQEHSDEAKRRSKTFCGRYNVVYLLYYESYSVVTQAIQREKEIKNLRRVKKEAMIHAFNPGWDFLNDRFMRL